MFTFIFVLGFQRLDLRSERVTRYLLAVSLGWITLAAGLLSRFTLHAPISRVLGLQALFGISACIGCFRFALSSSSHMLREARLAPDGNIRDIRESYITTVSSAIMMEMLGGSIGVAAAQAVLVTRLSNAIPSSRNNMIESVLLRGGLTNFKEKFIGDDLAKILEIWNDALTSTFYVPTAAAGLPFAVAVVTVALLLTPPGLLFYFLCWRRKRVRRMGVPQEKIPTTATGGKSFAQQDFTSLSEIPYLERHELE
jgi:hypothetical protein